MAEELKSVTVIGGGVIGCFITYRLALEGVPVTLIERDHPGVEASGRSAGNVQPSSEMYGDLEAELGAKSLSLYRRFLPAIKEKTSIDLQDHDVEYLYVAFDDQDTPRIRGLINNLSTVGLRVQWIDAATARELEPRLSPKLLGGMLHRDCIQLNPQNFTSALAEAAQAQGAKFVIAEAVGLRREGERVAGVHLRDGDEISCDTVVLAMGAWTGTVAHRWLGSPLPVEPWGLEKLHLRIKGPALGCAVNVSATLGGINIVTRLDGLTHTGSKPNPMGFDVRPTEEGKEWLLNLVGTVLPELDFEVTEAAGGCAASTPGKRPIIGPIPFLDGLYVAVTSDEGFLQSAAVADIITDLLVRGREHPRLEELLPQRVIASAPGSE